METTEDVGVWLKSGCLQCEWTYHGPETSDIARNGRCPNDGSVLLRMDGFIVADDIIAVARLMAKADSEKRQGQRLLINARADLGRVQQLIDRRTVELGVRP